MKIIGSLMSYQEKFETKARFFGIYIEQYKKILTVKKILTIKKGQEISVTCGETCCCDDITFLQ